MSGGQRRAHVVEAGYQRDVNAPSKNFDIITTRSRPRIKNQQLGLININKEIQDLEFKRSQRATRKNLGGDGGARPRALLREGHFVHRRASAEVIKETEELHLPPLSSNSQMASMKVPKSEVALAQRSRWRHASVGTRGSIDESEEHAPAISTSANSRLIDRGQATKSTMKAAKLHPLRLKGSLHQKRPANIMAARNNQQNDNESQYTVGAYSVAGTATINQPASRLTCDPSPSQELLRAPSVASLASSSLLALPSEHSFASQNPKISRPSNQFLQRFRKNNPNIAAVDSIKLDELENQILRIQKKHSQMHVNREYMQWAVESLSSQRGGRGKNAAGGAAGVAEEVEGRESDGGEARRPQARDLQMSKHGQVMMGLPEMRTKADVIFKFKNIFIRRRNGEAAVRLQALLRGSMQRRKYLRLRERARRAAQQIQSFVRMRQARRRYLRLRRQKREEAALICQKYLRGCLAFKQAMGFNRIDVAMHRLTNQIDRLTIKHQTDLQIKLRHAWRLHKRRLEIADRKRQEEKKEKKARRKTGKAKQAVGIDSSAKLAQNANVPESAPLSKQELEAAEPATSSAADQEHRAATNGINPVHAPPNSNTPKPNINTENEPENQKHK